MYNGSLGTVATLNSTKFAVLSKVSKRLAILKRTKQYMTLKARMLYYTSLIQSTIDFGATVWGSTTRANCDAVVPLQKTSCTHYP
jgi:hypothetical protein